MNLFQDLQEKNLLTNIIYINILVFTIISLVNVFSFLLQENNITIDYLGVSANLNTLKNRPWTMLTYMFVHADFLHLLVNLFWLFFSGKIFIKYISQHKMLATYIMGGISGALLYILSFNIFPVFEQAKLSSLAIGASASVFAILFAVASHVPNYRVNLIFLGQLKLKHIALLALIIDILSIPKGNAGGHIAHIGGALYGYMYIMMSKKNINTGYFIEQIMTLFYTKNPNNKRKYESDYEYNERKQQENKEINQILDKISHSGYNSLSEKEKKKLFDQK